MQIDFSERRKNLLKSISNATKELLELEEAMQAYESLDYLTTTDFARLVELEPKTISNYASSGRIHNRQRKGDLWLIHKSELENFK